MSTVPPPSIRSIAISQVQAIVSSALLIGCGIAFARSMTVEQYGELEAAEGALAIMAVMAALGMDSLAVRAMRTAAHGERWSHGRGFRHMAPRLVLAMSVLTWGVCAGLHWLVHDQTAVRFESMLAVTALLPLVAMNAYFIGVARAMGASRPAKNILYIFGHGLLLGLILVSREIFGDEFDVLHAAGLMALAMGLSMWLLLRCVRTRQHDAYISGDRRFLTGHWVGTGVLFLIAGLLLIVLEKGGVIVLGWVHADAKASAHFGAASRLAYPLVFVAMASLGSFLPSISDAIDHGDGLDGVRRRWMAMMFGQVTGLAVVLAFAGGWALSFWGPEFVSAWPTLLVLLVAQSVAAISGLSVALLIYVRFGRHVVALLSLWAVLGVAGMLLGGKVAHDLGIRVELGVALGQAVGLIGAHATLLWWVRHVVWPDSGGRAGCDDHVSEPALVVEGADADASA